MGDQHESYSEMLEQSLNLRWPKKGDRLFKESPNWEQSVKIPNDIISRHAHIWGGNMRAGAVLIGVRIPMKAATDSNPKRPLIPI